MFDPIDDGTKINLYIVRSSNFTKGFVDEVHQKWNLKKRDKLTLPPHDHIMWDLELSPIMPEFSRIDSKEAQEKLSRGAQKAITRKYSQLHTNILESEIERLETRTRCQQVWSYQISEVDRIWEVAVIFSRRIKEARGKFGSTTGNAWREQISPEAFRTFRERLDWIFTRLKEIREKDKQNRQKQQNEVRLAFERDIKNLASIVASTTEWKKTRESLKELQNRMQSADLARESRDILRGQLNAVFDRLSQRQTEANEQFERNCRQSIVLLDPQIRDCERLARSSDQWNDARDTFKKVRDLIREKTLKKEDRAGFLSRIDQCFTILIQRQDANRERYAAECKNNYTRLFSALSNFSVSESSDFKQLRESLFSFREDIKISQLKKDQRNELFDKLSGCFDRLKIVQDRFYEARHREFEMRRNSVLQGLREKYDRLQESIEHDKGVVSDKWSKYESIRMGPKYYEIRDSIKSTIDAIEEKIASKKQSLNEIAAKIRDIANSR
ncbi:MAG: hypothetical protein ACOYN2_01590 [Patescibacteria group bacterium]